MSRDLLARLIEQAPDQAREAVATHGYFTPVIDVAVDEKTVPLTVTLKIDPGPPTRVASVRIDVTGPAADEAAGARALAQVREDWKLPQGAVFQQEAWDDAKARAVAVLAASPYAAARLASSEARIDPQAQQADLSVEMASGPPFRIGETDVTGLRRYDATLVRNYSTFRRGDPYSGLKLEQYLRRLSASGYFASAQAAIDVDPERADAAPLNVAVIEAPPRRIEAGIGYSTDTEYRANANYRDVNVDGRATQFIADVRVESLLQSGSLQLVRPPTDTGWIDTFGAKLEHTNLNELVTRTASAGVRRVSLDERDNTQFGAAFYKDEQVPRGADKSNSHATYVDAQRIWRRVDDLIAPTRGYAIDLMAGAGVPGVSTRGFGRVVGRLSAWYPPSSDYELSMRLDAGAVIGATRREVPSPLLFRTGGDTSVRGYAYESIGVPDGDATVPGRYLVVGSVEATRWITQAWGLALFVDAGDAFDSAPGFRLNVGYGVGARVRTPIGPFRFDVAYGEQSRQVRIHFSVGLTF